jgi:hypothetical protein
MLTVSSQHFGKVLYARRLALLPAPGNVRNIALVDIGREA